MRREHEHEHTRGINDESPTVSAAELQKYLAGIEYPATKHDAIEQARENNAPEKVIKTIRGLPEDEFGGPQEIQKAFGDEKRDE
ncbi:MAG TPA: DUF2795 domain-containing protein [Patescibacteria group bacterium]|nr:DUF2795 domain-containing protein [Patescibacteria group bacterium]